MILKTKEFREAANAILLAVGLDKNAANLELHAHDGYLCLNVTNKEFYVSVKFKLEQPENFRAVIEAKLFLNLISGLTTETFSIELKDNIVIVKAGKSNYKLPMIYENENLMELPVIELDNKTVEMTVSKDILSSILNVNSKEISKVKNIDVNELQKLYYVDEAGCFTFTTGACLNAFTLDKPIKLLLNDRIVKLFKLFTEDANLSFGHDFSANGTTQSKVVFETPNTYVAALVTCDDVLLTKVQGPCEATKKFINDTVYNNKLVVSANEFSNAIARLMLFTKNSVESANMSCVMADVNISTEGITVTDSQGNTEFVTIENGSQVTDGYAMKINIADIKLILDSCKNEHVTINCGANVAAAIKPVLVTRGPISNLVPEVQ